MGWGILKILRKIYGDSLKLGTPDSQKIYSLQGSQEIFWGWFGVGTSKLGSRTFQENNVQDASGILSLN